MSASDQPASVAPPPPSWRRDLLLLALAFGALYFFRLGSYPLGNPDEGRNAEIAREMLATGDFVTPRLNGVNYFEKPPLVYWAIAGMEKVFGLNAWAVRAVPALFALWGVLLTYAAARRLYGREAGLASAVVLGTSLLWFALGHIPILDMAVSVLMARALFCFIIGVELPAGGERRWCFYKLYASMALATLAKGLIGFLVTGAVMFLWLLVFHQWKRLRPLHLPTGALLFLAIAAPWHVLAALRNETWVHRYFVYEHFERFLTPVASRPGPWYYFLGIVIAGLIPWTGFLWPAVRDALRGECKAGSPNPAAAGETAGSGDPALQPRGFRAVWARRHANADAWFLVTWAAFILFFFSISKSKLPPYILPIFPALAVLIGAWLARAAGDNDAARVRAGLGVFSFLNGALAVALCVVVSRPALVKMDEWQALALQPAAWTMAAALLLGGIFAPGVVKTKGVRPALAGVVATAVVFLGALQFAAPYIPAPGTEPLARLVRERAQPGDRVLHYHEFFHDFTFYAQRVVDVVAFKGELELEEDAAARASGRFMDEAAFRTLWAQPGRVFAVARKRDVEKKLFADSTFHYHLLAQTEDHYLFSNQP
jgi:4-amino-4-deoxy-L-arabinose transferase-like glycosyltransferase